MKAATSNCHAAGHPEIRIDYDPTRVLEDDAQWLLRTLEQLVAEGERYRNGETLQLGWMLTSFRSNQDGTLSLLEPSPPTMPIRWVESVTLTLSHLRTQKDVATSFKGVNEPDFPNIQHACVICTRLSDREPMSLMREALNPKTPSFSGWYFVCLDPHHDHDRDGSYKLLSLYEAAFTVAASFIPYVALPPPACIELGGNALSVWLADELAELKPGSFLYQRYGERMPTSA